MIEIKDDDLPVEAAKKIIFAKKKTQTLIEREVEADMFGIDDLEEIAMHIMAYCKCHND